MVRTSSLALVVLLGCSLTASSAANVQVFEGNSRVGNAIGSQNSSQWVDFGSAEVATVVSKTFTVRNEGADAVLLSPLISVPRGFTLMRQFGSTKLAPGQTTNFTVALNSAAAGNFRGRLSFAVQNTKERIGINLTGIAYGPPSMRIIRTGDAGFRTIGKWTPVTVQGQGAAQTIAPGSGTSVAVWTFTGLRPGHYQVSTTWTARPNQAGNAQFSILNGTQTVSPVTVNQQIAPSDFRDAGVAWRNLGRPVFLTGHTLTVRLTDRADGQVLADAVRIERVGFPGRIISPADKGFAVAGKWNAVTSRVGPVATSNASGAGQIQATWTFTDLVPGQYRVSGSWDAGADHASNALYTIIDGNKAIASVKVNQQQAPKDFRDAGIMWQDLGKSGNLVRVSGKMLTVHLTGARANGAVSAGPLRVERIYNPGGMTAPEGVSYYDAVRFLEQATWGPDDVYWLPYLTSVGFGQFLADQAATPPSGYPVLELVPDNSNNLCQTGPPGDICRRDNYQMYPLLNLFFTDAFYQNDQLRQRMAWAWHKIIVVSGRLDGLQIPSHLTPYLNVIDQYCMGNYYDLLYNMTLTPAMGRYLDMNISTRSSPNENYAREILQLFSIGLDSLNPDGTPIRDPDTGLIIPTYTQDDIIQYTRALTGWVFAAPPQTGYTNYRDHMIPRNPETMYHDRSEKFLLPLGYPNHLDPNQSAQDDLTAVHQNIFSHPNLGPFVARSLIQQLVTSNPAPDYIARVAGVFNDRGDGVRGDLSAVTAAILLDPAARGDVSTDPSFGKLREPVQYLNNCLRAFYVIGYDDTPMSDGNLNGIGNGPSSQDQSVLQPPTVFSYYLPAQVAPYSGGLLGPEFGIFTTSTTYRKANMINQLFMTGNNGISPSPPNTPHGTKPDLTNLISMAGDPGGMADYLNGYLLHGTMSQQFRDQLVAAINAVAPGNPTKRAKTAAYLVLTSAQYQVQQ